MVNQAAERPNFIIVYCDDLGYGDLGCYGSDTVRTPNLDRLAGEGIRFTDWYSNSPVCSPSRASLLTGRYPNRTGINKVLDGKKGTAGLPQSEVTLASELRRLGYRTALFGKWHLGSRPENLPSSHGFDEFCGLVAGCSDYFSHMYYYEIARGDTAFHDLWQGGEPYRRDGEYMTDIITERAVDFLNRQTDDEPFFMYVPYNAPHFPLQAPRHYMDRFEGLPWDRRVMAAMISAVDDGVGKLMDTLRARGLRERTVVFFSSDNGPCSDSRNWQDGREDLYYGSTAGIFRGRKGSVFDGGIREPALLYGPAWFDGGRTVREPCMMADVYPTFLRMAGGELPEDRVIDGQDLLPMLTEGAPNPHERLFWGFAGQLAVREGRFKLVLNGKLHTGADASGEKDGEAFIDPVHLSDLETDPRERVNVKELYPEVAARLEEAAREWFVQVNGK